MWPAGRLLLFQFAVVWQPPQSPVSMVPDVWSDGRSCKVGLAAPMKKETVAVPWQLAQVVETKAWVACVMFIGPKVPAAYVVDLWQALQSVPARYAMCGGARTLSFTTMSLL